MVPRGVHDGYWSSTKVIEVLLGFHDGSTMAIGVP